MIALPLACTVAFRFLIPDRTDYAGHFLAGFAASLAFVWIVARVFKGSPAAVVAGSAACVGLGLFLEATVFPLGGFDHLDFYSQSAGAALAGLALLESAAGDPDADPFDGISLITRNGKGRLVLATSAAGLLAGAVLAFS